MKNKNIIVKQQDIKDCGACSLQSIIKYYNGYVPLEKIREDTFTSKEGTSLYNLKVAANKYGFDAIAKKYSNIQQINIKAPMIIHVKYENGLNHFMCLYQFNKNKYFIMDPAKGVCKMPFDELNKIFTGATLELFPKSNIMVLDKSKSIFNLFINIIKHNKKLCFYVLLSSIIFNIFTIINSFYFKVMYEFIMTNHYLLTIKFIIYLFLIVVFCKIIYGYLKSYYENYLSKNIDVSVYQEFINHIFKLPLKVINTRTSGEIITRIKEISSIKDLFSQIFVVGVLDSNLFFCSFLILLFINIKIAILILFIIVLYSLISIFSNKYVYGRIKQNIDYETNFNDKLIQSVDMINSIKNLNKVDYTLDKIETCTSEYIYDNYSFLSLVNKLEFIKSLIIDIGIFLVNTLGFYLIINNIINFTDLIIINSLIYYLLDPIRDLMNIILKYNYLKASFYKISEFIDLKEENKNGLKCFNNGSIIFKNVCYSYNNYNLIVDNINFTINKGDKVFLKGTSGSGKSTICKLLLRNIIPIKGEILINNINILDYGIDTLKSNMVYISQYERLFTGTIKDNILLDSSDEYLFNKVCKICYIDKIVSSKPLRYESGIDNSSVNVSGGEKQRIVLARGLMLNKDIIIIDEALSETDFLLESKIINNIINEFKNKTIIYISHKNQEKLFDYTINLKGQTNE